MFILTIISILLLSFPVLADDDLYIENSDSDITAADGSDTERSEVPVPYAPVIEINDNDENIDNDSDIDEDIEIEEVPEFENEELKEFIEEEIQKEIEEERNESISENDIISSNNDISVSDNNIVSDIMSKPINEYTVEESILLMTFVTVFCGLMYFIVRKAVLKWR